MELSDIIIEVSEEKYNNYLKHKKETIRELRNYLLEGVPVKEFKSVLKNILAKEEEDIINNAEYVSDICVIYNLSIIYKYLGKELKFELIRTIIYCINKANGNDMFSYVNKIFNCLGKNTKLLNRIIDIIFSYDKMKEVLFYQYVSENFKTLKNVDELIKEVDFWNNNSSKILSDDYYIENAAIRTKDVIELNRDKEENIRKLKQKFDVIFSSETYRDNIMKIYKSSEEALLKTTDLEYITLEQIKNIAETIKYAEEPKVRIIKYLNYTFKVLKGKKLDKIFDEFYMVEKSEVYFIKKILKRLLVNEIKEENYTLIIFAHTDFNELCRYESLMSYIGSEDKGKLYEFVKWSFNSGIFRNKRTMKVDKLYVKSLKEYLINNDKKVVKNKKVLKQYFDNEESKIMIEEIKYETAGAIKKLMYKTT